MYASTLPRSNWLRRASIRLAWYRHMPASSLFQLLVSGDHKDLAGVGRSLLCPLAMANSAPFKQNFVCRLTSKSGIRWRRQDLQPWGGAGGGQGVILDEIRQKSLKLLHKYNKLENWTDEATVNMWLERENVWRSLAVQHCPRCKQNMLNWYTCALHKLQGTHVP